MAAPMDGCYLEGEKNKMQLFDVSYFIGCFAKLLPYLPITLMILAISLVFSLLFGLFLAWCKLRKNPVVRGVVNTYTEIIRGTPFVVLLFIIYFGLPKLFLGLWGVDINGWNKMIYIIATLSIFGSARMSEAMRAAYLSVNKGQTEAALSCGLSEAQAFWHIVMPQALLIALPNLGNLILSNLLETAVGFSIGIVDFVGNARLVITRDYGVHNLEVYVRVALVYWVLSMLFAKLFDVLELALKKRQGIGANGKRAPQLNKRRKKVPVRV